MKKWISILIIIISILVAVYLSVWVMFVGGIVQIVNSINPLDGIGIALGACKILFCELPGLIPWLVITIFYLSKD